AKDDQAQREETDAETATCSHRYLLLAPLPAALDVALALREASCQAEGAPYIANQAAGEMATRGGPEPDQTFCLPAGPTLGASCRTSQGRVFECPENVVARFPSSSWSRSGCRSPRTQSRARRGTP